MSEDIERRLDLGGRTIPEFISQIEQTPSFFSGNLHVRCGAHPTYRGIYPPRVDCPACDNVFEARHLHD